MKRRGSQLRTSSFTCTVDGLDHAVSAEAAASGLAARQGIYTAVCGHQVHVTALASTAGPSCPRCAQLLNHIRPPTANPPHHRHRHRRTWLRRLLRALGG
ncbi:MAG: hypothetical protein JOZ09_02875 [Pseudonocardiales bacterium]|nr:hypothetical protein [Pseudonocardiales bacterium]